MDEVQYKLGERLSNDLHPTLEVIKCQRVSDLCVYLIAQEIIFH